ncbi:hypothetical protein LY76DRAFT_217234 [Colletotrichum caudatum]|nr:hypothetical protein LY76DRAFT_217234 [Colletotrichum caudatum]
MPRRLLLTSTDVSEAHSRSSPPRRLPGFNTRASKPPSPVHTHTPFRQCVSTVTWGDCRDAATDVCPAFFAAWPSPAFYKFDLQTSLPHPSTSQLNARIDAATQPPVTRSKLGPGEIPTPGNVGHRTYFFVYLPPQPSDGLLQCFFRDEGPRHTAGPKFGDQCLNHGARCSFSYAILRD